MFRISLNTLYAWDQDLRATDTDEETVGSRVRPRPPVRRYADVVRHLVRTMADMGFGGSEKIAEYLANAGLSISGRTVARCRKEAPAPNLPKATPAKPRAVRAKFTNHVWMMDITTVPRLLGLPRVMVAAVFDVFSRMPLAVQTFPSQPSGEEMAHLLGSAARRYGSPPHMVTDHGRQFTSDAFTGLCDDLDIKPRLGAIGQSGSIALIERFWRTLKESLPAIPFVTIGQIERHLQLTLTHYVHHRPHRGLGGATPISVYRNDPPPRDGPAHPPRGLPGEFRPPLPVRLRSLDPEGRFPILDRAA
jgi:putative transposase